MCDNLSGKRKIRYSSAHELAGGTSGFGVSFQFDEPEAIKFLEPMAAWKDTHLYVEPLVHEPGLA